MLGLHGGLSPPEGEEWFLSSRAKDAAGLNGIHTWGAQLGDQTQWTVDAHIPRAIEPMEILEARLL